MAKVWVNRNKAAHLLGLTVDKLKGKEKRGEVEWRKNPQNGHVEILIDDELVTKVSDDSRYQKARADKMEEDAQAAAKKNLAATRDAAVAINMEWDSDFRDGFLPVKDRILEILKKLGASKKDRKDVEKAFDTGIEYIEQKRMERYMNDEALTGGGDDDADTES